jgi:hypothetical protein
MDQTSRLLLVLGVITLASILGLIWRTTQGRAKLLKSGLQVESHSSDVLHIEVDITNRLDLANKYNILQTPTTLVLDKRGVVQSRIGGAPKQNTLEEQLGTFVI